jgi:uncharacterized protein YgiM (DUF1202 family)
MTGFAFYFNPTIAQTEQEKVQQNMIDEKVEHINSLFLFKTFIVSKSLRSYALSDPHEETTNMLYFDSTDRIRKSMHRTSFPESLSWTCHYYNEEGMAIRSYYYQFSGMLGGYSVSRYLYLSNTDKDRVVYIDFKRKDDERERRTVVHTIFSDIFFMQNGTKMPETDDMAYNMITCTDSLSKYLKESYYELDSIVRPKNCMPAKFMHPLKGQKTIINGNDIGMRNRASINSKIITTLDIGDEITVVEEAPEWYKISYDGIIGYIHKKYLEPIEI